MRDLLDSIPTRSVRDLRDRALLGTMAYTFARVGAVLSLRVEDYYVQKRRGWLRLHEKGGKVNEIPCHHNLEKYLEEYLHATSAQTETVPCSERGATGSSNRKI